MSQKIQKPKNYNNSDFFLLFQLLSLWEKVNLFYYENIPVKRFFWCRPIFFFNPDLKVNQYPVKTFFLVSHLRLRMKAISCVKALPTMKK